MNNRSIFFKQIKLELCYEKIGLGFISLSYDDREAGFDSLLSVLPLAMPPIGCLPLLLTF
jgi:hypothetical protein